MREGLAVPDPAEGSAEGVGEAFSAANLGETRVDVLNPGAPSASPTQLSCFRNGSLAISDGRLAGVGGEAELRSWCGPALDAEGHFITPGFIDIHVHGGDKRSFAHTRHGITTTSPVCAIGSIPVPARPPHSDDNSPRGGGQPVALRDINRVPRVHLRETRVLPAPQAAHTSAKTTEKAAHPARAPCSTYIEPGR